MKIRFISDIHAALNMTYEATDFVDIMHKKEKADVTLVAGDMDADIEEAKNFLNTYFKDEKVIFIGGNHITYHKDAKPFPELISDYKKEFTGQWKFLENDYIWLNNDIAVIGCIGWTDFLYGHQTKAEYIKEINAEKAYQEKNKFIDTGKVFGKGTEFDRGIQEVHFCGMSLPDDPAKEYDELDMGNKDSYRGRRMKNAINCMNDYRYGYWRDEDGKITPMYPSYTYEMHKESLKAIKKCYKEIIAKNPNATIILMTHHPFTKKCESKKYKDDPLNAAFMSNHDNWLKKFKNIKYYHCGHVHSRFFNKLGHIQLICNPMGYLAWYEHIQETPFNINCILDI